MDSLDYSEDILYKLNTEFTRLKDTHYLDHGGTTLYAESQLKDVFENFNSNLFCNPHTSKITGDLIDQVRYRVLKSFNTDADDYHIIFMSGASAALKTVAECFQFSLENNEKQGDFMYSQDNHTSVLGMREVVHTKNIKMISIDDLLNISKEKPNENLNKPETNSLITFPAQTNFNGEKYPLRLINDIHKGGLANFNSATSWYVCLDAAAFVPSNFMDLKKYPADFVTISFYKIFGYPTGLGALLVSNRGAKVLNKRYYGGGTVKIALTEENFHVKRDGLSERFEDGTIPFLSIIAILSGYKFFERVFGTKDDSEIFEKISNHTFGLAKYLYDSLLNLKYSNNQPLVKLYSDTKYKDKIRQGGALTLNVLRKDGSYVGFAEVAYLSSIYKIIIRTGCFCNTGACQHHLKLSTDTVKKHYQAGHVCSDAIDLIDGFPTGCVRVSIGYMTQKKEIDAFLNFLRDCYLNYNEIKSSVTREDIELFYKPIKNRESTKSSDNSKREIKLLSISVFPIKSCGPFKVLSKWPLTSTGLKYDRNWMIIDSSGSAITQKHEMKLCLIKPIIYLDERLLELNYPGFDPIKIPLDSSSYGSPTFQTISRSKVCGDHSEGVDCGNEVASWLDRALNRDGLRLIMQNEAKKRYKTSQVSPSKPDENIRKNEVSFADQSQFLMVNASSVKWLADQVDDWEEMAPFDDRTLVGVIDRFRGNFVVESSVPLEELEWKSLQFGSVELSVEGTCNRCQMICIDQDNGTKTTEPLRTIARLFQGKMKFGLYLSLNSTNFNFSEKTYYINCDEPVYVNKL